MQRSQVIAEPGNAGNTILRAFIEAGAFALAPLHETEVAMFDRMVAVNLRAAFLLTRAFLPALLAVAGVDEVDHPEVVVGAFRLIRRRAVGRDALYEPASPVDAAENGAR